MNLFFKSGGTMKMWVQKYKHWFMSFSPQKRLFIGIFLLSSAVVLGWGTYQATRYWYQAYAPLKAPPAEIVGSIITLKRLSEEHIIDYHNMFSAKVRQGMEFPEETNLGYTIAFLQRDLDRAHHGEMLAYAIFDNKDACLIGSIEIREKTTEEYTTHGQFGVWLNEKYWGGGRTQEAVKLMAKTYFRFHENADSFNAYVRVWNKRSYYALKKAGFTDVGYVYENGKATKYVLEFRR